MGNIRLSDIVVDTFLGLQVLRNPLFLLTLETTQFAKKMIIFNELDQTTNLRVGRSNRSGSTMKFKGLGLSA